MLTESRIMSIAPYVHNEKDLECLGDLKGTIESSSLRKNDLLMIKHPLIFLRLWNVG